MKVAAPRPQTKTKAVTGAAPPRQAKKKRSERSQAPSASEHPHDAWPAGIDPAALLAWYDRHRRHLPWRVASGQPADPYCVWLSEIMLQQTTVKAVVPYYGRFLARWPTIADLAAAPLEDVLKAWAGLGYYARARNLHACAQAVADLPGGRFPDNEKALRALPGIGDYTAAAIVAIAFGRPATPVDGNIERVLARLARIETPLPAAKPLIRRFAAELTPSQRAGDFAQAMMDLGATICTPKRPACALCPWRPSCRAHRAGDPEFFPRKAAKTEGALRRGAAFVVHREDERLLVRTRPSKGLLAGMTEVPTSAWSGDFDERRALADAPLARRRWRRVPGVVTHTFTHFPLELAVFVTTAAKDTPAPAGTRWTPIATLAEEALPSLMRKVIAHALDAPAAGRNFQRQSLKISKLPQIPRVAAQE
ncbi:MAG: A/G-specific adenine glycosylase [Variibacter sp.]